MLTTDTTFACDAMLGGLARWLRAAGYDASWQEGIADWDLVRQARSEGRVLLSSDTGIFRLGIVRDGKLSAFFVPHGLSVEEQLILVLHQFNLEPRQPRCMACGGILIAVDKSLVQDRVPAKTFAWQNAFFECQSCGQVFWQGTHWQKIAEVLSRISPNP